MGVEISETQRKRVAKVERLRKYFGTDRPEIYEWTPMDEKLEFATMSDVDLAKYLSESS
jgi:hypothetical protein